MNGWMDGYKCIIVEGPQLSVHPECEISTLLISCSLHVHCTYIPSDPKSVVNFNLQQQEHQDIRIL